MAGPGAARLMDTLLGILRRAALIDESQPDRELRRHWSNSRILHAGRPPGGWLQNLHRADRGNLTKNRPHLVSRQNVEEERRESLCLFSWPA